MIGKYLMGSALALSIVAPACAATTADSASSSNTPGAAEQQNANQPAAPKIANKLRKSLAQAGFTDVHIMPQSFLVRAKDQDGNPVMMVINPDSMTAITALDQSGKGAANSSAGNGTSGSGSSGTSLNHKP